MNRLAQLEQVFAQIARAWRLGRWCESESRAELDLGQVEVLVTLRPDIYTLTDPVEPRFRWNWSVFEEIAGTAPGTPRFVMLEGGTTASKLEAKLHGLTAVSTRHARAQLQDYKHQLVGDLIALALVRLDAEMEGRPVP